jgi:hypothetical protein
MLNKYLLTQLNEPPQARMQMKILHEWIRCRGRLAEEHVTLPNRGEKHGKQIGMAVLKRICCPMFISFTIFGSRKSLRLLRKTYRL